MNTHFRFELNIINENFICSSILRALFISSSFRFYFHSHDLYPFFRSSHFFCGAYSAFVASFDWLNNINNNNKKRYVNFLLQFHCFFFGKCTTFLSNVRLQNVMKFCGKQLLSPFTLNLIFNSFLCYRIIRCTFIEMQFFLENT